MEKRIKGMTKVYGLHELAMMIEADNKVKELNKRAKNRKVKELVEQGIDKELAKVMVETGCVSLF